MDRDGRRSVRLWMTEHFNTGPDWPQSKAEVDAASTELLTDFMAWCSIEPADFDGCLACYAYAVVTRREQEEAQDDDLAPEQEYVAFKKEEWEQAWGNDWHNPVYEALQGRAVAVTLHLPQKEE